MKYKFTNVLGTFILDENLNIISNEGEAEKLPDDKIRQVLSLFKDKQYFQKFYEENLKLTKQAIKDSVNEDQLIIQAISNINEIDHSNNLLIKRLREWHSLYFPELSEKTVSNEKFLASLDQKKPKDSMGAELSKDHLQEMTLLAKEIESLYRLRRNHEEYLQKIMQTYCPNILELAGVTIGAKLIELAKGLKKLALLPASTIQLLGAEKALFRHIKTGSRSPKHGVIIHHPLVQNSRRDQKGKAARILADKLSLCSRLDYFKGEFKAKEYRKELNEVLG